MVASWLQGHFCHSHATCYAIERIGGDKRDRTADLLHAILHVCDDKRIVHNGIVAVDRNGHDAGLGIVTLGLNVVFWIAFLIQCHTDSNTSRCRLAERVANRL